MENPLQSEDLQSDPCRAAQFLVAHRGDRAGGDENTLAGFAAAAAAGTRFAECDIQFTRDLVPVVLHDNWLKRLCGRHDIKAIDTPLAALRQACLSTFALASLEDLMQWLAGTKDLVLFVEIKPTIRRRLSDKSIAGLLMPVIPQALLPRVVIISKSGSILDACAARMGCRIGWVAEGHHPPRAKLDYLFMPWQQAQEMVQWQSRGVKVGLYTVNDAAHAMSLRQAGADLIETDHFSRMASELEQA